MKYVPLQAEIYTVSPYGVDYLKHIEKCGRTCYRSLDKITEDSALPFIKARVREGHYSILEHANFVFELDGGTYYSLIQMLELSPDEGTLDETISDGIRCMNFTRHKLSDGKNRYLVSGNLRALINARAYPLIASIDAQELDYKSGEEEFSEEVKRVWSLSRYSRVMLSQLPELSWHEVAAHFYITFHFTGDVGVMKDLTRHRRCSWTNESTRWCDYNKERLGASLNFVHIPDYTDSEAAVVSAVYGVIEKGYQALEKSSTDKKRAILPHGLAAQMIMTSNVQELTHVFKLRANNETGHTNPVVNRCAVMMRDLYHNELKERGFDFPQLMCYPKSSS